MGFGTPQDTQNGGELKIDFPGFGMHSFRRGLVTKFQEVGGSAIEAQKTAGHSRVETTSEYTILRRARQEEIVRRVQERWSKEQQGPGPEMPDARAVGGNSARFCANSVPRRPKLVVIPGGKRKQVAHFLETGGGPVATRTPDLYRVKVAL